MCEATSPRANRGERHTWREQLRASYAIWTGDLARGFEHGDGWASICEDLLRQLENRLGGEANTPNLRFRQIKEKLGSLRVYFGGVPEDIRATIDDVLREAEARASLTCEICGQPGALSRSTAWVHVACPAHENAEPPSY